MKTKTQLLVAILCITSAAGYARGQITVDGYKSFNSTSATFSDTFDARSSDKLVVVATGEHGFNNDQGELLSIKYDGVDLIKAIDRNAQVAGTDTIYADIWYLDNPGNFHTAGVIDVSAITRGNITVIGLSGTADGVGNVGVTPTDTRSIDLLTSAQSIVLASFSMGGAGNTANVTTVSADAPLTQIAALENGSNWDGQVVGYANNTPAGTQTYSFTGGNLDGSLVIAAEFLLGPPPPLLTLQVNTTSGSMKLIGDADEAVSISYYEINSPGHSLNATGWTSLADQDFDGNGPPDGSGNGWEEAGGSGAHALAEAYLLGHSPIGAGTEVGLGGAYDVSVDARDLGFRFLTDRHKTYDGVIEYVSTILGDLDEDGDVDNADIDYLFAQINAASPDLIADLTSDGKVDSLDADMLVEQILGTAYGDANLDALVDIADLQTLAGSFGGAGAWHTGDFDGDGSVTIADLQLMAGNFGFDATTPGSPGISLQAALQLADVPEPTSVALLALGGLLIARRRPAA